ncbi:GTPase [Neobacillus jeddahensis]|uniref:GTPase n=1 Tax=Neobacillus jeddahensis TaxID=1461580 RepID=UPI00058DC93E|nr:GTPase [Neobacillus jeddahensis]
MWWIPVTLVGGYLVKKVREDKKTSSYTPTITTLERNMNRLSLALNEMNNKKKIAVLGQPGAGKSTLIDLLTSHQCSPRPSIGQKTDATNWSESIEVDLLFIYRDYVFVDVPGYDTSTHPIDHFIQSFPFHEFDRFLFVVKGKIHQADEEMWNILKALSLLEKTQIVRSYSDTLNSKEKLEIKKDLFRYFRKKPLFISSRYKEGLEEVLNFL